MSKNKMVNKASNRIIDKMGTLINHDCEWTSKSCKDIFIQKFGDYYSNISVECSCFYPFCCIASGHHNVPIAKQYAQRFNRSNRIQSPLLK